MLSTVSLALAFRNYDYLVFAFVGGLWFDVLYGVPIGSFTIPLMLIGFLSSFIFQKWLFTEVKWQHFLSGIVIATLVLHGWIWLYTNALFMVEWSPLSIAGTQLLRTTVFTLIANVLLAYPVYVIVELIAQSTLRWKRNQIKL